MFFRNSHTMAQFHRTPLHQKSVNSTWSLCARGEAREGSSWGGCSLRAEWPLGTGAHREKPSLGVCSCHENSWGSCPSHSCWYHFSAWFSKIIPRNSALPAPDTQPTPHCLDIYSELWFPFLPCSFPGVHTTGSNSHLHFPLSPDCPPLRHHRLVLLP